MRATPPHARDALGRPAGPAGRGARLLAVGVGLGGLGVSLAMVPGGYNPFGPVKAFVLLLAGAMIAAGFALAPGLLTQAVIRLRHQRLAWAAAALAALAALSTLTSVDPSQSLVGHYPGYEGLLLVLLASVVGLGACALAGESRNWALLGRAAAIAVLIVSAYATLQYLGLDPVPSLLTFVVRRVRSTLGNASNLGVFLVLALPLVLARVRTERRAWRAVCAAAVVAGVVVLAWSLSRGAWLGLIVAAAVWLLVEGRRWSGAVRAKVGAASAGALVVGLVALALLVPNASTRLSGLADPSTGTPAWRLEVWGLSARLAAERPALGWGPGSFRYVFPPRRSAATMVGETGEQVLADPHNVLVSAAVAGGMPALLALLAVAVGAIALAWRLGEDEGWPLAGPALASALAGGFAALQFHFFTLDSAPLFAMLVGVALGRAGAAGTAGAVARPDTPSVRATAAARWLASALTVALTALALAAFGLVAADRFIAAGWALVEAGAPWSEARSEFARAESLAPWEPATQWALGRGATRWMSRQGDASAFADAEFAMLATARRLPADPLVLAQVSEAYLVAGLIARDTARIETARTYAERALALDPQNGYRWETLGTARAALSDASGAIEALERAVGYAPGDRQAWLNLARVYEATGRSAKAAEATKRADALSAEGPGITGP